jgi:hypothetical protein
MWAMIRKLMHAKGNGRYAHAKLRSFDENRALSRVARPKEFGGLGAVRMWGLR